jgi:hypothetical protein
MFYPLLKKDCLNFRDSPVPLSVKLTSVSSPVKSERDGGFQINGYEILAVCFFTSIFDTLCILQFQTRVRAIRQLPCRDFQPTQPPIARPRHRGEDINLTTPQSSSPLQPTSPQTPEQAQFNRQHVRRPGSLPLRPLDPLPTHWR